MSFTRLMDMVRAQPPSSADVFTDAELVLAILKHLRLSDLGKATAVNRSWFRMIHDDANMPVPALILWHLHIRLPEYHRSAFATQLRRGLCRTIFARNGSWAAGVVSLLLKPGLEKILRNHRRRLRHEEDDNDRENSEEDDNDRGDSEEDNSAAGEIRLNAAGDSSLQEEAMDDQFFIDPMPMADAFHSISVMMKPSWAQLQPQDICTLAIDLGKLVLPEDGYGEEANAIGAHWSWDDRTFFWALSWDDRTFFWAVFRLLEDAAVSCQANWTPVLVCQMLMPFILVNRLGGDNDDADGMLGLLHFLTNRLVRASSFSMGNVLQELCRGNSW